MDIFTVIGIMVGVLFLFVSIGAIIIGVKGYNSNDTDDTASQEPERDPQSPHSNS